jgi:hypothetical protein
MRFDPMLYIAGLLLIVIALNFLFWGIFRRWPKLLLSENERLSIAYFLRFEDELKPYIPEWFDIKAEEWDEFASTCKIQEPGTCIYDDFVEFKHPTWSGRFVNIHPAGFRQIRDQGPWPTSPEFFNIFFFGGSTALNVGPDWTAIPSYLQAEFVRRATGRPIRVYNFGRGSYFTTQERILFQQLLLSKAVPDMVIFLDGVNDFYFFDGRPSIAGFYQQALDAHNRENHEAKQNRLAAKPKWQKLQEFVLSLPIVRAFDVIGETLAKQSAAADEVLYRPIAVDPEALVPAMDRYLENKRQIEALCREYGIRAVFVWQPTPAYKYDLQYHIALNRHYGLGGHARSGIGYELMAKRLETHPPGDNFIWLADIQENEHKPLYLDSMHYTSGFSEVIARHIADAMIDRGLIPGEVLVKRHDLDVTAELA